MIVVLKDIQKRQGSGSDNDDSDSDSSNSSSSSDESSESLFNFSKSTKKAPTKKGRQTSSAPKRAATVAPSKQTPQKKKAKIDITVPEAIGLLQSVSAHGISNPSNGTRERDIQSKLTKCRNLCDSLDLEDSGASELRSEIERVTFLKSLFQQLTGNSCAEGLLDTDLVGQLIKCGKEDVITVASRLHLVVLFFICSSMPHKACYRSPYLAIYRPVESTLFHLILVTKHRKV